MQTEKEKMLAGELYNSEDPQLKAERLRARELCKRFNDSDPADEDARQDILRKLLGRAGNSISIEPPFRCDYGSNIIMGNDVYLNFNCVILDVSPVTIGDTVLLGPNVQIYTATHPMSAEVRREWLEYSKPITIGSDVWIGGGAIICPGVNIGSGTVIGAGSVVTRDIPDNVFAAGNPCRVIRELD
jgi:maltose O-acetyltransferase